MEIYVCLFKIIYVTFFFVVISEITVCQLAPLSCLALKEVVQSTACLPVFVISCFGRATLSSNEILSSLCPECHCYHPLVSLTPIPLFWCCPLSRGSLPSCLLYQRDLHLKKPTVPPLCSMLACSSTNRPWPTCSFSSRLPSYHQVKPD